MSETKPLIQGEFSRKLDDRWRLSIPGEILERFRPENGDCIVAKEQPGCISLWSKEDWGEKMADQVALIEQRLKLHQLDQKIPQLQTLGRLLSTRQRPVQMAERGRVQIPEGFREFLKVEEKGEVMVIGAGVCVEIWNPTEWVKYVEENMQHFQETFAALAG